MITDFNLFLCSEESDFETPKLSISTHTVNTFQNIDFQPIRCPAEAVRIIYYWPLTFVKYSVIFNAFDTDPLRDNLIVLSNSILVHLAESSSNGHGSNSLGGAIEPIKHDGSRGEIITARNIYYGGDRINSIR